MARESTIKVVSFNVLALASVGIGLFCNLIQPVFINDKTHLCYLIAATMISIVFYSIYDCFRPQHWIKGFIKFQEANLRLLGLIGTLIGLLVIIAVISDATANVGTASNDMIPSVLAAFAGGLRTAFSPTLVGIVGWYWTRHILYFKRNDR